LNTILSLYPRHDANLTVTHGNTIIKYLEFEKIAKKRHFAFSESKDGFLKQFRELALPYLDSNSVSEIIINWANIEQLNALKVIFPHVGKWTFVNHHISHVWSAYAFTNPEEFDLIISYDGGGDLDDYFKIFEYRTGKINLILDLKVNLGKPYRLIGLLSEELYKERTEVYPMDRDLAGKIMALQALGTVRKEFINPIHDFYSDFMLSDEKLAFRNLLDKIGFEDKDFLPLKEARDIMSTAQFVFEKIYEQYVYPFLETGRYKRLIVVGGCALNVTTNSKTHTKFKIPIFIPPCPNDSGISIGIQKMMYPSLSLLDKPYADLPVLNKGILAQPIEKLTSRKISIKGLAELIASGKIIGTIVEPIEIGPRALGNRSYLANPLINGMKNRMNTIKGREFWRPVAPIITIDCLGKYFKTTQNSPYMTFAPIVQDEYKQKLNEVLHYDSTARIQTVTKKDGWIYELVKEVGKITGYELIMNTSFNKKGAPLINDIKDALELLLTTDLDGVLIENDYYEKIL